MKAIASGSPRWNVYVDLMEVGSLTQVVRALRKTLSEGHGDVWPSAMAGRDAPTPRPRPTLVPLDRLGAQQGYSGSSVFIAYFVDGDKTYLPSKPIVVKVGDANRLRREYDNVSHDNWPRAAAGNDTRFAYPFLIEPLRSVSSTAALLAPFSSENALDPHGVGWRLRIRDLWQVLTTEPEDEGALLAHITALYELLRNLHMRGRRSCVRAPMQYATEYSRYLRGVDAVGGLGHQIFGTAERTSAFGRTWLNPCTVVQRVMALPAFQGASGPVHGDLHPKNVVFDRHLGPNLIDWGWAHDPGHVPIDYLLMDINLRAMTLPSQIPIVDIFQMAQILSPNDAGTPSDRRLASRMETLRDGIWAPMIENKLVVSWEAEYLYPMLLTAFGLLKHLDSARSQVALLATVLSLAERIGPTPRAFVGAI